MTETEKLEKAKMLLGYFDNGEIKILNWTGSLLREALEYYISGKESEVKSEECNMLAEEIKQEQLNS